MFELNGVSLIAYRVKQLNFVIVWSQKKMQQRPWKNSVFVINVKTFFLRNNCSNAVRVTLTSTAAKSAKSMIGLDTKRSTAATRIQKRP
jgi:hypothetical protein